MSLPKPARYDMPRGNRELPSHAASTVEEAVMVARRLRAAPTGLLRRMRTGGVPTLPGQHSQARRPAAAGQPVEAVRHALIDSELLSRKRSFDDVCLNALLEGEFLV